MRAPVFVCAVLLTASAEAAFAQDAPTLVCLAPASAEMVTGDNAAAAEAVAETFTEFLTGPTIGVSRLGARLESQARIEAASAGCPHVLFTAVKQSRKEGSGLLGRMAGRVAEAGAYDVIGTSGSATTRVLANAAGSAARDLATGTQEKDELKLEFRLESADGRTLLEHDARRKAKADGEDLLTPLVGWAAEIIAESLSPPAGD